MLKKIIILSHPKGCRLANQLWNYASIYAYSLDINCKLKNYSFFEDKKQESSGSQSNEENVDVRRQVYWWKYKTYILVEIGAGHHFHNYFIELVKGRNPRFLHIGHVWDNPNRLQAGAEGLDPNDFDWVRQCRVLSEYENVSCDELFKKKDFRFIVRTLRSGFHLF